LGVFDPLQMTFDHVTATIEGMDPNLMFAAGRIAGERGWTDAAVITVAQLPELEPDGVPLVLVAASDEIGALAARLISSVESVGRSIMVVSDEPLAKKAAIWLNSELVQSLEDQQIPKLIPDDPKFAPELSAHERREQEELLELKKVQKTPSLMPDQPNGESVEDEESEDKKRATASNSAGKSDSATDKKHGSKPGKQASGSASKSASGARGQKGHSGGSKSKASSEALREFRSLASD
jgi:hypothetical protein